MHLKLTPNYILFLEDNEVFVYGSNESGNNAGGAAATAEMKFGAKDGVGFGPTGKCFAIPTLGWNFSLLKLSVIHVYVRRFIQYAKAHPNKTFLVTPIGCGIAGFKPEQIAPMFRPCLKLENVALPLSFLNELLS